MTRPANKGSRLYSALILAGSNFNVLEGFLTPPGSAAAGGSAAEA